MSGLLEFSNFSEAELHVSHLIPSPKPHSRSSESEFNADDDNFRSEFKVPPFQDCVLSFLGFSEEEKTNMEERTLKHGRPLRCSPENIRGTGESTFSLFSPE